MRTWLVRAACRSLHALLGWLPPRRPRVLLYHSIDRSGSPLSIAPEVFAAQMAWLRRRGWVTWKASRFVEALRNDGAPPRRTVVLTFDDGLRSTLDVALPELSKHGFEASVFVVTGCAGEVPRWMDRNEAAIDGQLRRICRKMGYDLESARAATGAVLAAPLADWESLGRADRDGLEVLSHSRTHPFLTAVDPLALAAELRGSLDDLRARGFGRTPVLAWPFGAHDDRTVAAARDAGYVAAFTSEPIPVRRDDPYRLDRVPVDPRLGTFAVAFALGAGFDAWTWLRRKFSARDPSGPVS